jgi:dTDP-4-amino-4,6-dideoxygalactose transaminase
LIESDLEIGLDRIPFNKPHLVGSEFQYISEAATRGRLAGDGEFTRRCSEQLLFRTGSIGALLTHSCTAALEMSAILLEIEAGDEVIMPSYTFVSTANAFVLRGAVPVFVDIRPDTLNIDEQLIEAAISSRTRAIVPVHYAGVACEMDRIMEIASRHGLAVVEDAAQGIFSSYKGRALGAIGHLGAFSFHETKNVIAGEGGALIINDPDYMARAEIIREKGTNRSRFFRGEVDKYTWVDVGSSYLPGELVAAFLYAQLLAGEKITAERINLWNRYDEAFRALESKGKVRCPVVPSECKHNAHMYYLLLESLEERDRFIAFMNSRGVHCVFHYVPLHSSEYGARHARVNGPMLNTTNCSDRLVRLPLWIGLEHVQSRVIDAAMEFFA